MIEEEPLGEFSMKVIPSHSSQSFFTDRVNQLKLIQSYHMYPIKQAKLYEGGHHSIIYLQQKYDQTLQDLINKKVDLLPSEIKSIIWQLTKFMRECQRHKINHLRLHPKSIVLVNKYKEGEPILIQIKDFSVGKQFKEVSEGKGLDFFQFMHPNLSVDNQIFSFHNYEPKYDIWSMGVILYYLIYKVSPFCKEDKDKYSKTILRRYKAKEHEIPFQNSKFSSINNFICKCLDLNNQSSDFNTWSDIKYWIIEQEQIYNKIDFDHVYRFEEMADRHIKLMSLFSALYCMVIEQCNNSPHPFWKIPVFENKQVPFQIQIAQFTLKLMRTVHAKFESIYKGHYSLLASPMLQALNLISEKMELQHEHKGEHWLQPKFKEGTFNLQTVKIIQEVCAKVLIELSDIYPQVSSRKPKKPGQLQSRNSFTERKIWRSMQILLDYCDEIIQIFNECKKRMKLIYQRLYTSEVFRKICQQDFHYQSLLIK